MQVRALKRWVREGLEEYPAVLRAVSRAHKHGQYVLAGSRGFRTDVHPDVQLRSPANWADTPESDRAEFFGYYDKSPWAPDGTKTAFHAIRSDGKVDIVVYDASAKERRVVAESSAWNYQQGSMLQWRSQTDLIFNDIIEGELVARIVSMDGKERQTIHAPIQTVHPSGERALTLNYRRLDVQRRQYGYGTPVENYSQSQAKSADGIWKVDFKANSTNLVLSLAELVANEPRPEMDGAKHRVNHIVYAPDGEQFVFMHRWKNGRDEFSRLYVADADGHNLRLLMDDDLVSHYAWRDERHLVVWGRNAKQGDTYYLVDTVTGTLSCPWERDRFATIGDGHPSCSPDGRWIVTDTYPNKAREQQLLLHDTETTETTEIGTFYAPPRFDRERSCDLHPRWNRDGTQISIDSAHTGTRSTYLLDISGLMEGHR